jgi:hypothetical protein
MVNVTGKSTDELAREQKRRRTRALMLEYADRIRIGYKQTYALACIKLWWETGELNAKMPSVFVASRDDVRAKLYRIIDKHLPPK